MKETNETTPYRITITLDSAEFPVDEQVRNALLTEFRSRVGHLVEGLRGRYPVPGGLLDLARELA